MFTAALITLTLLVQDPQAVATDHAEHLLDTVTTAAASRHLPGASIALIGAEDTPLIETATAGTVERNGDPVTSETRFLAGSIGKTFASLITTQLHLEGRLDLDAPISTWLADRPWFDRLRNGDQITLRQLLNHSAGVPDYLESARFYFARFGRGERGFTPDEIITYVAADGPSGEPGAHYSYSDTHYILVGLILEEATGERYADLVRQRVIEPLGLTNTQVLEGRTFENLATGHDPGPFGTLTPTAREGRLKLNYNFEWAAGGIVSTPTDLARFYWALGGDELAAERSVMMANANPINPDHQIYYGLGVFVRLYPDDNFRLFHGGSFAGYRSAVVYDTRTGYAIALQGNSKAFEAPDVLLELNASLVDALED
jgi:D-alanyl-D-alanine carboxypeptidase